MRRNAHKPTHKSPLPPTLAFSVHLSGVAICLPREISGAARRDQETSARSILLISLLFLLCRGHPRLSRPPERRRRLLLLQWEREKRGSSKVRWRPRLVDLQTSAPRVRRRQRFMVSFRRRRRLCRDFPQQETAAPGAAPQATAARAVEAVLDRVDFVFVLRRAVAAGEGIVHGQRRSRHGVVASMPRRKKPSQCFCRDAAFPTQQP